MTAILIIDDEPGIRNVLKDVLADEGYRIFLAEDGIKGLGVLEREMVDLVILDVWLPNMGGMDVLKKIKEEYQDLEVIIISGHANINLAVKAVKMGAFDFLEKPLSLDKTITVVRNALKIEDLKQENRNLKNSLVMEERMIGNSPGIIKIRELIDQSAKSSSRIMILGENGSGKELVAKEIHRKSDRAKGPFVEVNCAAIPETLIESELFGHEKGAFTNAVATRKGKFELAHKGTLFLDEIADMSLSTQAKVLRAVQEQKFERIGGENTLSVDIRFITATNKNIEEEIKAGRFREDLYFRLNVIPIFLPPLRERIDDMEELVDYFMKKFKKASLPEPRSFDPGAMEFLKKYDWPGNIRELKNFIERINIMSDEEIISLGTVEKYLFNKEVLEKDTVAGEYDSMKLNDAKDYFEKEFILRKLKENDYNISKTAQVLGIYPSNLHGKVKKFGIKVKR
ncbi:MAG: sigma-54-dependent Fis family transcriptional regulator [Spirochaetales bacterium]|nr:sigma-54-dependent Fis family transcriptional regulator [Spirochaetales bacterium]